MFKFLRKYNKWILAVGGGLLMIIFLLGDTLPRLTGEAGVGRATRATIQTPDGSTQRVPMRIWSQIQREYEFIRQLERQAAVLPALGPIESSGHWYLLSREAELAGLVGSQRAIGLTDEQLLNVQLNTGFPRSVVVPALAKIDGINRLFELYLGAAELSDRRLRQFAARTFHNFDAQMVVFTADADEVDYTPTEDELQEQYAAYRDVAPGDGEKGFGYLLPDRFKLEWLRVSAEEVREAVRQSDEMNNIALRAHWRRNPEGTFPAVDAAAPVPDEVREHKLNEVTERTLEDITRFAGDYLRAARRELPERNGYVVLPEDWSDRRPSFRAMAEAIQERFNVALPEYTAVGDRWLTMNDIADLGDVARASTDRYGARPLRLADLIGALREFGGSPLVQIQAQVAGPPLRGPNDDVYVFRVSDVDPSRPPHSLDEVRDEVTRDLRRLAHYQVLVETSSAIEREAAERGLLGVSLAHDADIHQARVTLGDFDELMRQMSQGRPPRLIPSSLPVIGRHRATVEQLVEFARSLPQDVPLNDLPAEQRITTVPVEDHLALLLVQVQQQYPLTIEDYREIALGGTLRALYIGEELDGTDQLRDAFSFDALSSKYNFKLQVDEDEDDLSPEELEELLGSDTP